MPHYLAIGVSWERFMDSCPKELEPYDIAHKKQLEEQDLLQHLWWGTYGVSAVSVAVERCLAGKKAKLEYIEKPVFREVLERSRLTEEQIYEQEIRKALLAEEQWIAAGRNKGLPETIV